MKKVVVMSIIMVFGAVLGGTAFAEVRSSTSYKIPRDSINVGGVRQTSTSYISEDSIGETASGRITGSSYHVWGGFLVPDAEDVTLSFSVSDNSIGFGTLSTSNIRYATADANGSATEPGNGSPVEITVTTNASNGLTVSARSKGNGDGTDGNGNAGMYKSSSPTNLVAATASSSVSGGSEGYGLYVKNVGSSLTADEGFDDDTTSDEAITTTSGTILSASSAVSSNNTADVSLKAAITESTDAGSYSDTVTLTATARF